MCLQIYTQTDFSLALDLKYHPHLCLVKFHWFILPLYLLLLECFWAVEHGNIKTTVSFHTSELSTTSFFKAFNFLFLNFIIFFFFKCIHSLTCRSPSLGPGRACVLHGIHIFHICLQFCLVPPSLPNSLYCHGLSISWNTSSHSYLSASAAFCLRHMERHSFSLRGDQADKASSANSLPKNMLGIAWLQNKLWGAEVEKIAKAQTKAFLSADPNNVYWSWWLILLLKTIFLSSIFANEVGLLEWWKDSRSGQLTSNLQLEHVSSGYATKDIQSSRILLLCQQTDPASC